MSGQPTHRVFVVGGGFAGLQGGARSTWPRSLNLAELGAWMREAVDQTQRVMAEEHSPLTWSNCPVISAASLEARKKTEPATGTSTVYPQRWA
jgi:hypothetical protein